MLSRLLPFLLLLLFTAGGHAAPVWTPTNLSEPAISAALKTASARAADAKSDVAPAWRKRVELLTQLLEVLREKARGDALIRADKADVKAPALPEGEADQSKLDELVRTAEQASADERRWTERRAAIVKLVEERASREQAIRAELERLEEADPTAIGTALQLANENRALETRLLNERLGLLARQAEPRWLAAIDRELDAARRGRRLALGQVRAYRERLIDALTTKASALEGATDETQANRHRILKADLARLTIDRELESQRQRLRIERNELAATKRAVERDVQSPRTAQRLKDTLWRLQRRRPEVTRNQAASLLALAEEAQVRRLDLDDQLLDEFNEETITAEERIRSERLALNTLITHADALRGVIDERARIFAELDQTVRTGLFWIQDVAPIWLHLKLEGGAELRRVGQWTARITGAETREAIGRTLGSPVDLILLICALLVLPIGLLIARRFLRPMLARDAKGWREHLRGVFVALLLAGLPAGSLFLTAMLVRRSGLPVDIGSVLSVLLEHIAWCLLAWQLVRAFMARGGLIHRALETESAATIATSRVVSWLIIGYAFLLLPGNLLQSKAMDARALARTAWLSFGIIVFLVVWRTTRRTNPLMKELGDSPRALRLAQAVRWLARLTCLVVIGMEALGYAHGASWLAQKSVLTVAILLPLGIGYRALADRFGSDGAPKRRVFRAVCLTGGVVGTGLLWGIDEGVFRLLGAVKIFGEGPSGISLLDIGAAIVVLIFTIIVLRVLPRIFKATVFRAIQVDEGLQYAITTIARYVLFFVGFAAVLSTLHINLDKLGWLVAALGVGLGFGLQEIVSNFVSGVIILVERPVKVGDFISIGSLEGRVLHINIRSTTLLSLDRREFIVPNKDLITKDVTNWTRTDRMVRMTIPIGVAYGSDVALVRRILRESVQDLPEVLTQPPPEVLFMGHGDSSLDFEVRLHVPDPWRRFKVLDRVNAAINAVLAEHDVEIPFPQRDLHIRSGLPERVGEPG